MEKYIPIEQKDTVTYSSFLTLGHLLAIGALGITPSHYDSGGRLRFLPLSWSPSAMSILTDRSFCLEIGPAILLAQISKDP